MPSNTKLDLVVTDLDGTLMHRGVVQHKAIDAIHAIRAKGIHVLCATARRPGSVIQSLRQNHLDLPAVVFDGAIGIDFTSNKIFHRRLFDSKLAGTILQTLSDAGLYPCINIEHSEYDIAVGPTFSTVPEHLRHVQRWLRRDDLDLVVATEGVVSFTICGRDYDFLSAATVLEDIAEVSISRDLMFGEFALSVCPRGVTKWSGVLSYCDYAGLDNSRVLAIGDGENDLSLIGSAAISIAAAGACDVIRESADICIDEMADGGWHTILDYVD